jgi:AcrR family transcriptional regulator
MAKQSRTAVKTAVEEDAAERIRKAAIALFKTRGYHGTPVRALASIVKIEAGSLYYHFPSKQEILFDNFARTMDDLIDGLRRAGESATDPKARLSAAVRFHVLFHVERQNEAIISHTEIRSLTNENRATIIAKRDLYERMFCDLLAAGIEAGQFRSTDIRLTAIAILTMCSGVSDWFAENGRLSAETVADQYEAIVLRMVGAADDASRVDRNDAGCDGI